MRLVHGCSAIRIANYLTSTSTYVDLPDGNQCFITRGVVYRPDIEKGIECYVDSDFYMLIHR